MLIEEDLMKIKEEHMTIMTREQRFDIIKRANKAWVEGDEKKAAQIKKRTPSRPTSCQVLSGRIWQRKAFERRF